MSRTSSLFALTPEAFWQSGRLLLASCLASGLLLLTLLAWKAPDVLPFFPLLLLGGLAVWHLFRHPLLNLCLVLGGFVLIADYEAGIQVTEVLYGLYYLGFLAHWFTTRLFFYRDHVLQTPEDKALLLFLVLMTLTIPLTVVFGGKLRGTFSEWTALTMLAFYFPVKEACVRERHGVAALVLVLTWIGLFVSTRNLFNYQEILLGATQLWQVTRGRVATNDSYLMIGSLGSLVPLIFAHRWKHRALLLPLFLLFFSGLILTQSRGFWIAFAFGAFVMFLLVSSRYKKRLVLLGTAGLVAVVGVGMIFFGDLFAIVYSGLLNRVASLGSATSSDVSLVNRFFESKAVWPHVAQNPILGRGMGVSYHYYDIAMDRTRVDTFIHNGFLSLWYRFGLWGLALVVFVWAATAWRGLQTFRLRYAPPLLRLTGLAVALCLIAYVLPANTSNPFYLNDSTFMFGLLMGLAAGVYARAKAPPGHVAPPAA